MLMFSGVPSSAGVAGFRGFGGLGDAGGNCQATCGNIDNSTDQGDSDYNACMYTACQASTQDSCIDGCSGVAAGSNFSTCLQACQSFAVSSGMPSSGSGGSNSTSNVGAKANTNPNSSSGAWGTIASIFGATAQGVTAGLTQKPGVPATPTSFLTSPAGIGVIAVGLIVGVVLLTRK